MAKVVTDTRTGRERRLANLQAHKVKPGQVLNPKGVNGATKTKQLTMLMIADGDALLPLDRLNEHGLWPTGWKAMWPFISAIWPKTKTVREFVSHMAWLQAAQDADARNKLQDRIEGKVAQPLGNDPDNPLFTSGLADAVLRRNGNLKAASD
jgi:hypothetical protein